MWRMASGQLTYPLSWLKFLFLRILNIDNEAESWLKGKVTFCLMELPNLCIDDYHRSPEDSILSNPLSTLQKLTHVETNVVKMDVSSQKRRPK